MLYSLSWQANATTSPLIQTADIAPGQKMAFPRLECLSKVEIIDLLALMQIWIPEENSAEFGSNDSGGLLTKRINCWWATEKKHLVGKRLIRLFYWTDSSDPQYS
jgi:hypothetical protein